jgi:DNA polymerase I-like protein with 3'-5' exonuclease and polymerase domains
MRIFDTANLDQNSRLSADETSWIYNGLDCCVTYEVRDKLRMELSTSPQNVKDTYDVAMSKLAPVNYMSITGMRVNEAARRYGIDRYKANIAVLESRFNIICNETLGYPVNWRSPSQLKHLFYDVFKLKVVRKRNSKGEMAPTVNGDALERFFVYHYPQVFARLILSLREIGKLISFLETEIDPDGRMRTSLNIAGTDTGRFSSRFSALGTGSNMQNIDDRLRGVFIPDDGYIFAEVDLEQADARNLGARIHEIFYDYDPRASDYLNACESGDLHTRVCSMAWTELPWPDPFDLKLARAVADSAFFGTTSYRDAAKSLGHGTNYFGTPNTMAMHTKTPVSVISSFQKRYFSAFPLIGNYEHDLEKNDWHGWVHRELKKGEMTTLFGRRRQFLDRVMNPATLRKAIAFEPQSMTGEELDRGWLRLWREMPEILLKLPVHDSILLQIPVEGLHELLPRALKHLRTELILKGGRTFSVPLEAKVGWNWRKAVKDKETGLWENANGLIKWTGKEERVAPKSLTGIRGLLGR